MFIDTEKAAARIGKSPSWLNHARQTGDGPPYRKVGRSVLYHVEDVDRWLESKVRTRIWDFNEKDREAEASYKRARKNPPKPELRKELEASRES
ncbi:helix-turn-helix transcriptional regulator [Rhizobium leguminosarum]|jgi:predicted DNA-binding transcriptional regulator AlpA|uniref:helix-turn-helix transcriptional regulator n=1 Tax=Rhizobium leguminosarum TaxID=384 RepID=UPI00035EDEF2|nr:helix-turn-helix domain-containing protein [Rhizobium leguminosarum]